MKLSKLKRSNWLILSGVLRMHENKFFHVLRRNKIEVVQSKPSREMDRRAGKAYRLNVPLANSSRASHLDSTSTSDVER